MLEYCFTVSLGKGYFRFLLDYVTEEPEGEKVIYRGAANILLGWDDLQLCANRVKLRGVHMLVLIVRISSKAVQMQKCYDVDFIVKGMER